MFEPIEFSIDGECYILARRNTRELATRGLQQVCDAEARRVLQRALRQGQAPHELRSRFGGPSALSGWQDRGQFSERLGAILSEDAGKFALLQRPRRAWPALSFEPVIDDLVDDLTDLGAAEQAAPQSWIEVLLIENGDDVPRAHVDYEIELSDGRIRTGKTNEHGILRYESIPDGKCTLRLPASTGSIWEPA